MDYKPVKQLSMSIPRLLRFKENEFEPIWLEALCF